MPRAALVSLATALAIVAAAPSARAWNPFAKAGEAVESGGRRLGKGLAEGAVEAIQPALATTIDTAAHAATGVVADVDVRLTRQVDHAGGVASQLVAQTEGALGKTLDHVDHVLASRVLQLDGAVAANLSRADGILERRSAQLGTIVSDALTQADGVLKDRIDQADQALAVRLGNVDVIATKQRLGLEQSLLRAGVLIGILVFVVYVLRTLWRETAVLQSRLGPTTGARRALGYAKGLARPLAVQLVAAGLAIAVLAVLYDRLPFGARSQAAELVASHRRELDASLARFDFSRVRFHASQLEILDPEGGARYQALEAEAELLRDLVLRPGLLATPAGRSQVVARVQEVERRLGETADPDLLTMKALVIWQTGDTKADEHEAASLCARALRLAPGGFTLAPLARHYIRMFLHAPYLAPDAPYGRNAESLADLRRLATLAKGDEASFPLAPVLELDRLMERVDDEVSSAYLAMVEAQADVVRASSGVRVASFVESPSALQQARSRRNESAKRVVAAWWAFDERLRQLEPVQGTTTVLAIFRLNDATYSRAAWYLERPDVNDPAPLLADVGDLALRARLAPPRVEWERRYADLVAGELRGVAALQEAKRFLEREKTCQAFERAFDEYARSGEPMRTDLRRRVATLAADLSLYVQTDEGGRAPAALTLVGRESRGEADLLEALQRRGVRFL